MTQVNIMDAISLEGANVLAEARLEIKKLKVLGVKVPKMRVRGGWKMQGFDFDFEDWQEAYPPLGNKYLKAGERKAYVEATETSELEVFFVFTGEAITDKNPLATGDLFAAPVEPEEATEPEGATEGQTEGEEPAE